MKIFKFFFDQKIKLQKIKIKKYSRKYEQEEKKQ